MASSTEVRSGIKYGWSLAENGWNIEMDDNLKKIGRFNYHLSVKDRNLTAPPVGPADGATYIVASPATGAWLAKENNVAVYLAGSATWVFETPRVGYLAYIEDEEKLSVYKVAGWSAGIAI